MTTSSHLIGEGNKPVKSYAKYTEILQASNEKLFVSCSVSKFLHGAVKNWYLQEIEINLKFVPPLSLTWPTRHRSLLFKVLGVE